MYLDSCFAVRYKSLPDNTIWSNMILFSVIQYYFSSDSKQLDTFSCSGINEIEFKEKCRRQDVITNLDSPDSFIHVNRYCECNGTCSNQEHGSWLVPVCWIDVRLTWLDGDHSVQQFQSLFTCFILNICSNKTTNRWSTTGSLASSWPKRRVIHYQRLKLICFGIFWKWQINASAQKSTVTMAAISGGSRRTTGPSV